MTPSPFERTLVHAREGHHVADPTREDCEHCEVWIEVHRFFGFRLVGD